MRGVVHCNRNAVTFKSEQIALMCDLWRRSKGSLEPCQRCMPPPQSRILCGPSRRDYWGLRLNGRQRANICLHMGTKHAKQRRGKHLVG